DPGENLHQRRLARAVLTDKTDDLARRDAKRHVAQGLHAGKTLTDADRFEHVTTFAESCRISLRLTQLLQLLTEGGDGLFADRLVRDVQDAVGRHDAFVAADQRRQQPHGLVAELIRLLHDRAGDEPLGDAVERRFVFVEADDLYLARQAFAFDGVQ